MKGFHGRTENGLAKFTTPHTIVQDEIGLEQGNQDLHCDLVDALGNKHWCQRDFWSLRPEDHIETRMETILQNRETSDAVCFFEGPKKRN